MPYTTPRHCGLTFDGLCIQLDQAKKKQRLKDGQAAAHSAPDQAAEQDDRPGPSALRFDVPTGNDNEIPAPPYNSLSLNAHLTAWWHRVWVQLFFGN